MKIYTPEGVMTEDFISVGDHKVTFQTRPEYIIRGVTEAELALNVTTARFSDYF